MFEEELLPDHSLLWDLGNVILTPHNSFAGEGYAVRLSQIIMSNLEKIHENFGCITEK